MKEKKETKKKKEKKKKKKPVAEPNGNFTGVPIKMPIGFLKNVPTLPVPQYSVIVLKTWS